MWFGRAHLTRFLRVCGVKPSVSCNACKVGGDGFGHLTFEGIRYGIRNAVGRFDGEDGLDPADKLIGRSIVCCFGPIDLVVLDPFWNDNGVGTLGEGGVQPLLEGGIPCAFQSWSVVRVVYMVDGDSGAEATWAVGHGVACVAPGNGSTSKSRAGVCRDGGVSLYPKLTPLGLNWR